MSNDLDFLNEETSSVVEPTFLKDKQRYLFVTTAYKGERLPGEKRTPKVTLTLRALEPIDEDGDFETAVKETEAVFFVTPKSEFRLLRVLRDVYGQPTDADGFLWKDGLEGAVGQEVVGTVFHEERKGKDGQGTGKYNITVSNLSSPEALRAAA